jgi:hypothetical protein
MRCTRTRNLEPNHKKEGERIWEEDLARIARIAYMTNDANLSEESLHWYKSAREKKKKGGKREVSDKNIIDTV